MGTAIFAVVYERGPSQARWLGIQVFGGTYLALSLGQLPSAEVSAKPPTTRFIRYADAGRDGGTPARRIGIPKLSTGPQERRPSTKWRFKLIHSRYGTHSCQVLSITRRSASSCIASSPKSVGTPGWRGQVHLGGRRKRTGRHVSVISAVPMRFEYVCVSAADHLQIRTKLQAQCPPVRRSTGREIEKCSSKQPAVTPRLSDRMASGSTYATAAFRLAIK